jgi:hypothetical protein
VKDHHFLGVESQMTANIQSQKYLCAADYEEGTLKLSNTVNNRQYKLLRLNTYFSVACLLLKMPISGIYMVTLTCPTIISFSFKIIIKPASTYVPK